MSARNHLPAASILTLAVLAMGCSSGEKAIGFERRQPDKARVSEAAKQDTETLGSFKPGGQSARVVELFTRANKMTARQGDYAQVELEQAMATLRISVKSCLLENGQETLKKLGLYLLAQFENRLDTLARETSKCDGAATALLTGGAVPECIKAQFEDFAQYGGGFLVLAAANELVKPGPEGGLAIDPSDRFFIRLAYKIYWSNALPEATKAKSWLLSDFERKWYEIWTVERSTTAPIQRKMAALHYLKNTDPDYPAQASRGIVLFQRQRYRQSILAFELALKEKPQDKRLKRYLAEAKRKLGK